MDTLAPLHGALSKRHQNSRVVEWGKRYVVVDDAAGFLCYFRSRTAQDWDEPARAYFMRSLQRVQLVDFDKFVFELYFSIPPRTQERKLRNTMWRGDVAVGDVTTEGAGTDEAMAEAPSAATSPPDEPESGLTKLVLRAASFAELQRWMLGLEARIRYQLEQHKAEQARQNLQSTTRVAEARGPAATAIAAATAAATHAAEQATKRCSVEASAEEICRAMGVESSVQRPSSVRGRGALREDIDAYLERQQQQVEKMLLEEERATSSSPSSARREWEYMIALGASKPNTPRRGTARSVDSCACAITEL